MLRFTTTLITALLIVPISLSAQPTANSAALQKQIDHAISRVKPALVRIHVVSESFWQGRQLKSEASGSGAIITKDGYILSNHHVAGHATRMFCTLSNNEVIEAMLIGKDALTDLAVLKLIPDTPREFPVAEFGDSDAVRVGDHVLAMGSPMALSQSVTLGIVSNTKLMMPTLFWPFDRFTLDGEDVGSIVQWIGHDAAIYGGNSGGPLVDLEGNIIGINEISFGLGGAIPGNLAKRVAQSLIEHGHVARSWLGLEVQPLLKHSGRTTGVMVSGAIGGSPADEAGVQSGDILLRVNGKPVSARFREELPQFNSLIAELPIGEVVELGILRGEAEISIDATTRKREEKLPKEHELKQWGMAARNLSYIASREMKRESQDGVLITSVRPGGPAGEAKPGLVTRDVIEKVNGTPVKHIEELIELTETLTADAREPVPIFVEFARKTEQYLTVVEVGLRELEDPGLEARKAWLPVSIQVITRDLARQLEQPQLMGVRITQVFPASTAEKAGLQVGDYITALDGEQIPAAYPEDYEILSAMIRQYRVGSTPELTIIRDGEQQTVAVELERAPKLTREMKKHRDDYFEFTARNVNFHDRVEEEWGDENRGVLVTDVIQGGWAALGHLAVDDLLVAVNDTDVEDVGQLEAALTLAVKEKPKHVVLRVLRGIHTLYLELEPDWK